MKSIRRQLLVWLLTPMMLVAAIVATETFFSARRVSNELHDQTLLSVNLVVFENIIASDGDIIAENVLEVLTENLGDQFFYHLAGPENVFVTGYTGYPRMPENISLTGGKPVFYDGMYRGDPVRAVAMRRPIFGQPVDGWATITTWQRIRGRQALTYDLFTRSILRLLLLTAAAGVIVWFAVSRGLKPLQQLQDAIRQRTAQDLTSIRRPMPVELRGIVSSMNDLFERVRRSKTNRERFIGDAAHQLRNPIAAIKVQAAAALGANTHEAAQDGLRQITTIADTTGKTVEQMLASAQANALDHEAREVFNIVPVVTDATRVIAPTALARNHDLALEVEAESLLVEGHKVLIQEAIKNLIDNAVIHTIDSGAIRVGASLSPDGDWIRVEVSDSGEQLSEDDLNRLSQPFATGNGTVAGSGLGLSIAKDVAKSNGGYLELSPLPGSTGKVISMVLPRVAASATPGAGEGRTDGSAPPVN